MATEDCFVRGARRRARIIDRHYARIQAAIMLVSAAAIWLTWVEPAAKGATACHVEQMARCPGGAR